MQTTLSSCLVLLLGQEQRWPVAVEPRPVRCCCWWCHQEWQHLELLLLLGSPELLLLEQHVPAPHRHEH
jgi:hypothetical protein